MITPKTKINRGDLKTYPSERLTDNDDGGGMPLGTPLTGAANELFNPIPQIVRNTGGFFARLMYMGVQRADDEPLFGSFAAITKPPTDPTVSYLMFPATKFGELRSEILKRIEAFNVASIESRMTLLSTQSQNSKIVQAYQRLGEPLPTVGDVYCLRQDKRGYAQHEQYIQVSRVSSEDRTFVTQTSGNIHEFKVTVVKMEISGKLNADFVGVDYPVEGYVDNPCKIRESSVADAADYYGVKPITEPILKDKTQIKIDGLMDKIVPTNQIETFLTNLNAAGQRQTLFDSAKTGADGIITLAVNKTHSAGSTSSLYLGNAATPKTVTISTADGDITDRAGDLVLGDIVLGTISYSTGELVINNATYAGYLTSVAFRPAGSEIQVADTARENVTINNRGYGWSMNITPSPAAGTMTVSYRAQGRWYELRDSGDGVLRGASAAHGSGSVNYATGGIQFSAGELPDVGSAIIYAWGTKARYFNRAGITASAKMILQLSQQAVASTIAIAWTDDVGAKTAVSDARGNITGDWTGRFDANSREILIDTGENFEHPEGLLDITVTYSTGDARPAVLELSKLSALGKVTFTAPNFLANTLRIAYLLERPDVYYFGNEQSFTSTYRMTVRDDGAGNLIGESGAVIGTIDYITGAGEFDPSKVINGVKPKYTYYETAGMSLGVLGSAIAYVSGQINSRLDGYDYSTVTATLSTSKVTSADVSYFDAASATAVTDVLSSGDIEIDLLPNRAEIIMPGSVNFAWGGKQYFDKSGGLYTDLNPLTGASALVGSVNYQSGRANLTAWDWTDGTAPTIKALATSIDGNPVSSATFRTPSAPIRAGSLEIRATTLNGVEISAKAGLDGAINAVGVTGFVDAEYGLGDVQFGNWVTAIGNESEPWYDADAVQPNGKIWRSEPVFAQTITYDARSYSYLPIDSSIVKIDTVRLPQDGRIPIFRRGDSILIGNRKTEDIGSAHSAGQTVTLSRADVNRISVSDADDKPVNADLWDYDLLAGTITWRTPLDLAPYKMPLKVSHAQEERNRITEPDIDGTLNLLFATKRAYPILDTYVSSVLIGGDLQVRVSVPFTQRNWTNIWQDTPIGEQLLNKLNIKDHPMVLTDDGAIKDRWMIKMTGTSTFELYSEALGFVMRGDTLTDLAPINPASGKPYFTLPKQAFGADAPWASQDIIRFNTWGTLLPVWVLCAVQPSSDTPTGTDGYTQCLYGDTTELVI